MARLIHPLDFHSQPRSSSFLSILSDPDTDIDPEADTSYYTSFEDANSPSFVSGVDQGQSGDNPSGRVLFLTRRVEVEKNESDTSDRGPPSQ